MPELRQLRAFVAVAEELNFTRAAERLFLGQQAVSKSVRALERELGVELLERTTREVRLTAAGETLLATGRAALLAADEAFERARDVGLGTRGTVRVGVSPAVGPRERGDLVGALRDGAPDLTVSVHEVRPAEVVRRLRDRELDLVLARTAPPGAELDSAPLRPAPMVLHVPAGHRLAVDRPVTLAELDGERVLMTNPVGTPFTDMLLGRLADAGATVEPVESRVVGLALTEIPPDVVAPRPAGWPRADGVAEVELADPLTLPLLVLWPVGTPSAAVTRVRAALSH